MVHDTADETKSIQHIQLEKIQELRSILQQKDSVIRDSQCKIKELEQDLLNKDKQNKFLIDKINSLKSSLKFLSELFQYECTNTREVLEHTDPEGQALI